VFFFGYALFEVPSSYFLYKVGAPKWLARIMITWGLATAVMAFVGGPLSFYGARFLIGLAEAGLSPGAMYYMAFWYTTKQRAGAAGKWTSGALLAGILMAPFSTWLLGMNGLGLQGWQWMFIAQAVPPIILGLCFLRFLPNNADEARWLPERNRAWLNETLAKGRAEQPVRLRSHDFSAALRSGLVWMYAVTYAAMLTGVYAILFWLPQLVKAGFASLSNVEIGFVSALPFLCAIVGLSLIGRHSDRTGDRRWHLAFLGLAGGVTLIVGTQMASPIAGLISICIGMTFSFSYVAVYWAIPMSVLQGPSAAAGLALINSVGNLGGFAGPYIVGYVREQTGSFNLAICAFSVFFLIAGAVPALSARMYPRAQLPEDDLGDAVPAAAAQSS
jgi:MFS family permease